ncbi:DUF4407 domain-containing protein [Streptosporangium sandarakinum]|uniref:DUF4407 domain-containing protein n=1 Tax=Streptosporangium nondiastaticum TaxID=35764 RepID=UPI0031F9F60C
MGSSHFTRPLAGPGGSRAADEVAAGRPGLGRRLRTLAGVDEGVLGRIPLERTRYVGLGGVVLGTAVVAGISMWFALSQVLGGAHVAMLIPVVVWALIVLNLDRWLVSTVTGTWRARLMLLVPRLLVAVVLGFIIAEPLVLRVFETAVVQHVINGRETALIAERDRLLECNSRVPGRTSGHRDCTNARLLTSTADADLNRLSSLERDAGTLRTQVAADRDRYDRLVDQATAECAGESGEGLSGRRGMGPLCRRLDAAAKRFMDRSGLGENQRKLQRLEGRISALRGPLAERQADFERRLDARVEERLAAMPGKDDPVGLLERMRALHEVTATNVYLRQATWLLRFFLILVDCLPVLVKIMSGTTAYDRMVDRTNQAQEMVYNRRVRLDTEARLEELELRARRGADRRRREHRALDATAGTRAGLLP